MKASMLLLLLLLLLLLAFAVGRLQVLGPGLVLVWIFFYIFNIIWLKPERIRRKLRRQGIRGPRPCLLYGNVPEMKRIQAAAKVSDGGEFIAHDYTSTLFPYFEQWRKEYGPVYTYSTGNKQHLYVNSPDLVKEMKQSTSLDLGKVSYLTKRLEPLLGNGILRSNGRVWAHQRKIISPEFFMDKVKGMVGLMVESTQPLVRKWEACIESAEGGEEAEIRVDEDLRSVSADVISRACFGSSYFKGKQIFSKLRILQKAISNHALLFGLPTIGCRRREKTKTLEREIESLIWEAVEERQQECLGTSPEPETDLMQSLLDGAMNDHFVGKHYSSKRFVVDNCKNIYFAGHESTAAAASWCLMLLALHPDWQARVREEAAGLVCRLDGGPLDANSLPRMKMMTMVIQEALRLYPPAAFVSREALKEMEIGSLTVPKGVCVWTLIPTLHRDPEIWGEDANEFKPERFANGVSGACRFRHGYLPFGMGPRLCLGRNFAMVQLKVVLAVIVSKFSFSLSPKYRHSPAYRMIVEPGHGVQIIIRRYNKGQYREIKEIMKTSMLLLLLLLLPLVVAVERLRGVVLGWIFLYVFNIIWVKPERLRRKLRRQGIRGPRPYLLFGNVLEMKRIQAAAKASDVVGEFIAHDYTSTLFPYFEQWRKEYGPVYTYSTGNKQHLYVNRPDLVKEMKQSFTLNLGKISYLSKALDPLLGNGILRSNGQVWAHQRKIIAPEFFMDKVKGMVGLIVESTQTLLRKWEDCIEAQGGEEADIKVDEDLRNVSADVISRACFGSSYSKGKEIISKLRILQKAVTKSKHGLLFDLPTIGREETRTLEKEIESLIWETVEKRVQEYSGASPGPVKDLLQLILDGAMKDNFVGREYSSKRFIVDNCKNIYFAGNEPTAVAASWCLILLALYPDWQARIREEVTQVCQPDGLPDVDSLPRMKAVTMVIQEALRLYPPAAFVSREVLEEMEIGNLIVPKGVFIWTLIPTLHRDRDIWGEDADEFRPERFANGVSGACKFPQAYLPFGSGGRLCLGRNLGMVQLKIVLALIVSKFSFSLSPKYRHSPAYRMTVEPGHGVDIVVKRSK
ncbi:uncharacterized protein LOC127794249 [Diospyros lotus]|uniref:uncharacterized protein LOC127794249 n=1 Tax=Diospyros lotus TaxID=55363 RepID=UPI00225A0B4F|nr:uncharacterized protein LOC127794249 [Diospyros lotus]